MFEVIGFFSQIFDADGNSLGSAGSFVRAMDKVKSVVGKMEREIEEARLPVPSIPGNLPLTVPSNLPWKTPPPIHSPLPFHSPLRSLGSRVPVTGENVVVPTLHLPEVAAVELPQASSSPTPPKLSKMQKVNLRKKKRIGDVERFLVETMEKINSGGGVENWRAERYNQIVREQRSKPFLPPRLRLKLTQVYQKLTPEQKASKKWHKL